MGCCESRPQTRRYERINGPRGGRAPPAPSPPPLPSLQDDLDRWMRPGFPTSPEILVLSHNIRMKFIEGDFMYVHHELLEQSQRPPAFKFLIDELVEWPSTRPLDRTLQAFQSSFPNSDIPLILMGAWYIKWAWVARSGASIDKVTRSGFALFQQYLARAQDVLHRARVLNPRQINTVALLLTVYRGRQAPKHVLAQLWEQGQQSCDGPLLVRLWATRLQSVASKWGGSHEQMFALARHAVKIAPPGHPLIGLIVDAHAEIPLYYNMEREELNLTKSEVNRIRETYFHKPEVRNEILEAYEKWSCQKDSVQYDEMEVQVARSLFALVLWWIWRLPKELGGQNAEHLKVVKQLVRSLWLKPAQLPSAYSWIPNSTSASAGFKQLCSEVGC